MNYKYIKKDFLWALAISIVLLLTGSTITTGVIWPIIFFIATLVLIKTSIQKKNLNKIVTVGRILTLQNSILLLWSIYYLIQNIFSNLPSSLSLIFSTAPIGLTMMIVLYTVFSSWSDELSRNKILDIKLYKNQMLILGALLLLLIINLGSIFSF
ncbi:MAG: hypothetical protein Q8P26_03820 [Candidatus Levybacteria bacterium]|nr:hypothetical protein [Candidatus Levybacteria bacterium]